VGVTAIVLMDLERAKREWMIRLRYEEPPFPPVKF
jgi:hypothetical protein